jgi:hypothetical protein
MERPGGDGNILRPTPRQGLLGTVAVFACLVIGEQRNEGPSGFGVGCRVVCRGMKRGSGRLA